jgi:hypothetical protein
VCLQIYYALSINIGIALSRNEKGVPVSTQMDTGKKGRKKENAFGKTLPPFLVGVYWNEKMPGQHHLKL